MSSLLIVGVDAKVFLIASADPCQADDSTAPLIGLLLNIRQLDFIIRRFYHPSVAFTSELHEIRLVLHL